MNTEMESSDFTAFLIMPLNKEGPENLHIGNSPILVQGLSFAKIVKILNSKQYDIIYYSSR